MLWSKTLVDGDSKCPSMSFKQRRGDTGERWAGFAVGSYVHNYIHHMNDPDGEEPDGSSLSVLEKVSAESMLESYKGMGFGDFIPDDATFEQSYLSTIQEDGSTAWDEAPPWAVRGDDWDPERCGEATSFRIQPDVWFFNPENPKEIVVYDWKTGWGLPSNSSLEKDTQAITYCAALAQMFPQVDTISFTWWNLRYKTGHTITKRSDEWIDIATPIWRACWARDHHDGEEDLASITRPGSHCGSCEYKKSCLAVYNSDEKMGDVELYRYSERVRQLSKDLGSMLRDRLKEETGVVELSDGVTLGPKASVSYRWRKTKPQAMEEIFKGLADLGHDPFDYIDTKGSTSAWIRSLPESLQEIALEHVSENKRVSFVTRKED